MVIGYQFSSVEIQPKSLYVDRTTSKLGAVIAFRDLGICSSFMNLEAEGSSSSSLGRLRSTCVDEVWAGESERGEVAGWRMAKGLVRPFALGWVE